MGLNIKNERVHELARRAAAVTGKTQTGAIEEALERLLADHGVEAADPHIRRKRERAREIIAQYQREAATCESPGLRIEDLYDEASGLPR